jgi:hypothetical protein
MPSDTSSVSSSSSGDGIDQSAVDRLMTLLGDDNPLAGLSGDDDDEEEGLLDEEDDLEEGSEEEDGEELEGESDDESIDEAAAVPYEQLSEDEEDAVPKVKVAINNEVHPRPC